MHRITASLLACPSCRCLFDQQLFSTTDDNILSAVLRCPVCHLATPVVEGFPLFGETRPLGNGDPGDWLAQLAGDVLDSEGAYRGFLQEKVKRKYAEPYAAFQPFNESSRALYPFLPVLAENLQPGDVILDTWCRTGWSGELLASIFPEQHVISIWEANSNVLGYRGFAHWLGEFQRRDNLSILFTHPDHALPLADNSVRVIHGLDSLHRYRHASYIPECLRVCREDGVLIFPHNHLTNSQPSPFFERGCQQYHGLEWKAWLDTLLAEKPRSAWIFAEDGLFEAEQDFKLEDESDTGHYNALILIADKAYQGRFLQPAAFPPITLESRFVGNALVQVDLHRCRVGLDAECLAGHASEMLERHPCYAKRLEKVIGTQLEPEEALFIWHARSNLPLRLIAQRMQISAERASEIGGRICQRELLHPAAVSQSMAELHNYYAYVELPRQGFTHFSELWKSALQAYGQRSLMHWLEDDSELQADDAIYLVDALRARLGNANFGPGSRILISSHHHPEALLICWAAWLQGMVTVIVDPALPREEVARLQQHAGCGICFTDDAGLNSLVSVPTIILDGEGVSSRCSFSSWLESSLEIEPPEPANDPEAPAVVLFTSGSTGTPKGVVLSQRALCNSGCTMAGTHGWNEEVLLSLGPLSMMSGLRNPAVAALVSGSTILVPGRNTLQLPLNAWHQAVAAGASVITAVPAWLSGILRVADRLEPATNLRQILLTGTSLSAAQRVQAKERLGVVVGDYYGLTETGGICTAALDEQDTGTLGRPVNALLHILDELDNPVGATAIGRLRVHSDQLMSGYLDDPASTTRVMQGGWLLTGDLAHWDEQGRLVLDGREDELLKLRNGSRFHPGELETVLVGLETVEAAGVLVVGENTDIIALVVSVSEPGAIRDQLSGKVASHLMPREIITVPELPVSSNGKLRRSELAGIHLNNQSSQ